MDKIRIKVPATSANLGSGFDCVGIAFQLYNVFSFEKIEKGFLIEGCDEKYRGKDNLAYVSYKAVCDRIGVGSNVRICIDEINIPVSRGLGSSATLICAGAIAANILNDNILNMSEILDICNRIEGHPDNVAPALYGGLCTSIIENDKPITVKYPVSSNLHFTIIVPDFEIKTKDARMVLPKTVSREDAVFNMSRIALLPHAFKHGDFSLIKLVTEDRLHEQYRKKLFKNIDEVEKISYEAGAVSFVVSGAGSSCLCISKEPIDEKLNKELANIENRWYAFTLKADNYGAREV